MQPRPVSGVGVLDKASAILSMIERHPATLSQLVAFSGLPRPTVHRIAVALERLDLLARDIQGRFVLGHRLGHMSVGAQRDRLVQVADEVLADLSLRTGMVARLHRRRDNLHICIASSKDAVTGVESLPVGTARPAKAGPIAQTLLAWEDPEDLYEGLRDARFNAAQLSLVRQRGWAYGPDGSESGLVLAVPVWGGENRVVAALVLAGSQIRMPDVPTRALRGTAIDAATELGDALPHPGRSVA
ncbi:MULTISPECIES: IclR family transcriptional regulator [unclassified Streptomyces]|uniref:IclR family transcriptional regulator n=1 Tax=unclassified Streptomyces TaxID=2593676 RepID=UPI0037B5C238